MSIVLKDGTVLPDIPAEVLAEYPNAVIYNVGGSAITAMFSKKPFAYGSANFYASLGITVVGPAIGTLGNGAFYILNGEWEKANDFTPAQSVVVVGDGLYDLQWSNHNIMVVQSANLSTMTANTNGEVYYAVDDVLVLKNGTKLLAPPKELFEEQPYGVVFAISGGNLTLYALATAEKQFVACREDMLPSSAVLGSDDTHGIFAQPGKWKRWFAGEEWTLDTEKTAEKLDALYIISVAQWANHDLCELSELNADYTYTIGSEIARKSDVNYRVTGGYMTSITNEGRRLGNREGELKPAELEDAMRNAQGSKDLPNGEETTFGYVFEGGVETIYVYAGFDNVPKEAQQLRFVICKNRNDEYRLEARELKIYAKLYDDAYYRLETYGGKSLSYMLRDGVWVEESTTGWVDLRDWSIVYSTDNISNSSGGYLATAGTPEIREGTAGSTTPVLREAEYRMTSDTMNRMCYIAQMAAGRQDLMLPDTALDILENSAGGGGGSDSGGGCNLFQTSASGRIPVYERGTAQTTLSINLTTQAY